MARIPDGSTVGVLGPADGVSAAVRDAGLAVLDGGPDEMDAADWVVAVGEAGIADLAAADTVGPVLPVGSNTRVESVPAGAASEAVQAVAAGEAEIEQRVRVGVTVDGESRWTALLDVLLVTEEPARISEFHVETPDGTAGQVRADGVVVATPAGSVGYASDAGGPVLSRGTGVLSVVPVAPFVTDADHWVVSDEGLTISVTRPEPVSVVVDGRTRATVGEGSTVRVEAVTPLSVLSVPGLGGVPGGQLEKH